MNESYAQGFMNKCSERGVDAEKVAQIGMRPPQAFDAKLMRGMPSVPQNVAGARGMGRGMGIAAGVGALVGGSGLVQRGAAALGRASVPMQQSFKNYMQNGVASRDTSKMPMLNTATPPPAPAGGYSFQQHAARAQNPMMTRPMGM